MDSVRPEYLVQLEEQDEDQRDRIEQLKQALMDARSEVSHMEQLAAKDAEIARLRDYSTGLHAFISWLSQRHEHDGLTKGQIIRMAARVDVGGKWMDDHVKLDGRTAIEVLDAEIADLKQERDEANAAKYLAEQKETAAHHALNEMRGERDALRHELAALWQAVDELEWQGGHCPIQSCHRNKGYSDPPKHAPDCPIGVAKVLLMGCRLRYFWRGERWTNKEVNVLKTIQGEARDLTPPAESIVPENYGAMIDPWAENARLRRALDLAGIPAQAALDDKAPPLRINVAKARAIMAVVDAKD